MSVDRTVHEITRSESFGSFLLWFGILAPSGAWGAQLLVNYMLEEWFACSPSVQDPGRILGIEVGTFALLVTSALLSVSIAGLLVAIGCYRRLRRTGDADGYQRARWMAFAGILSGTLYTGIIIASFAVPAILGTCRTSP